MLAGLITQGALGIGEAAVGLIKSGEASAEAARLKKSRPKLKDSQYLKDQLSLAESDLSNGMSADSKRAYEEGLDSDLSSSLGTITRMGGSPNDVGSVFANNAAGRARLSIMKDNMRMGHINNLVRAEDANEEMRQKQFQFNEWAPWADAAQANAQAKSNAQSEIFGGLNTLGGGIMKFGEAKDQSNDFQKYLKTIISGSGTGGTSQTQPAAPDASFLDGLLTGD